MDFGALLRQTRQSRGLDQAALARRSGTTQTYVSRIERGDVSPSLKTMNRLMHAMGQQLTLGVQPLSVGNVTMADLKSDLELSPAERVEEAMELSEFLVGVSQAAAHGTR